MNEALYLHGPRDARVAPYNLREGKPGEVTLFTSKGAGHTWPGGHLGLFLRLLHGRTSTEIDATETIWNFAREHAAEA